MKWLGPCACALSLTLSSMAHAEVRVLVAVGADVGAPGDVPLRYAASDALRLAKALEELGTLSRSYVLTTGGASDLQQTLRQVKDAVAAAHRAGERTLLLFYYSGHADLDFLHAFGTRLSWDKLRSVLRDIGADVTVSFIDTCSSGGAAAAKGATPGVPFTIERDTATATGTVWITSSRGDEKSFESDELGGSFFTHYLVSAVRGAADFNEDGHVTLSEMYQFAYQQTVSETSLRLRSVQHPTYGFDLAGEGEIVLAELQKSLATLVLPRELQGVFFLSRRYGANRSTIEIAKKPGALVRVGVGPGSHLLYRRDAERIWLASYDLRSDNELVVNETDLKAHRYENVVGKGGAIVLDGWQTYAGAGVMGALIPGAPSAPILHTGLLWHQGGLGLGLAAEYSQFSFPAIETHIDNRALELTALVEGLMESGAVVVSIGGGVSALWLTQLPAVGHNASSLTPGIVVQGRLQFRLAGPVGLWLEAAYTARLMRLTSERDATVRANPKGMAGLSLTVQ